MDDVPRPAGPHAGDRLALRLRQGLVLPGSRRTGRVDVRHGPAVKILYLADIRFPLERANGIQTAESCHALALRGHDVTLLVRPDTASPPREPWSYYDLPPTSLNPCVAP